jgi:hypothetical protein
VRSAAAARSQRGEKPKAAIEPSSTMLPTPLRIASCFGGGAFGSGVVGVSGSTSPTSSMRIRRRFFALAS